MGTDALRWGGTVAIVSMDLLLLHPPSVVLERYPSGFLTLAGYP